MNSGADAPRRVLVVGAGGFIGGALTRRLTSDGVSARAMLRQAGSSPPDLPTGVEVAVADVSRPETLDAAVRGCDVVVNLAGVVRGPHDAAQQVNVDGARAVCEVAIETGVTRLVHVSTAGVYGFRRPGDVDETTPVDPGPVPYPRTKAEGERVVAELATTAGMAFSIIRPGLVYGPGSAVWTTAMFRWARRRPTLFLGDGGGLAPVVHVDDVVDLISVLIRHDRAAGEIFNCAADPVPTWRQFLGGYAALAGHSRWLGLPLEPVRATAGLVARLAPAGSPPAQLPSVVDFLTGRRRFRTDKAADLLDWRARVGLADGIASCAPFLRGLGLLTTTEGKIG